jgi:hypothetical protein
MWTITLPKVEDFINTQFYNYFKLKIIKIQVFQQIKADHLPIGFNLLIDFTKKKKKKLQCAYLLPPILKITRKTNLK